MKDQTPTRTEELLEAHPWLTEDQAYALIADRYSFFLERYKNNDTQALLSNWVAIACKMDTAWVKDRLAVAAEWSLF